MSDDHAILAMYAEGDEIAEIATQLETPRAAVSNALSRLCGYNRDRARELAGGYAAPMPEAEPAPEPVEHPKPKPTAFAGAHLYTLLDEAEATGDRRLVRQAGQVRTLLDEIRDRLESIREEQAARAEVTRLEAELAAAKARLKGGATAPVSPAPQEGTGPLPADLRAWAAARGIECPDRGRVPHHIRDAWNAEQAEAAA